MAFAYIGYTAVVGSVFGFSSVVEALGIGWVAIVLAYLGAGAAGGALLGLSLQSVRSERGAMVLGFIVSLVALSPFVLGGLSPERWFPGGIIALVVISAIVGPFTALVWTEDHDFGDGNG